MTEASAPAVFQTSLPAMVRAALRDAHGRVALLVPAMAPHRRRVARALLQEGALTAGGVVAEGADGALLLIGAEARRATRLRGLLDRLLGGAGTGLWSLERDATALLDYAVEAEGAARGAGPGLAGLDHWLRGLPMAGIVRRDTGMRLDANGAVVPAFLRLSIDRVALRALMGGIGADPDLRDYAARILAARLLRAIHDPAQRRILLRPSLPGPLHLPLPPAPLGQGRGGGGGGGGGRSGLVATLGLEAAADPGALAARRAYLAAQGWALELEGLGADALRLLAIEALPADWLRLDWSPALAAPTITDSLRRADPGRLILAGADEPAALAWARRLGLRWLEGRAAQVGAALRPAA